MFKSLFEIILNSSHLQFLRNCFPIIIWKFMSRAVGKCPNIGRSHLFSLIGKQKKIKHLILYSPCIYRGLIRLRFISITIPYYREQWITYWDHVELVFISSIIYECFSCFIIISESFIHFRHLFDVIFEY